MSGVMLGFGLALATRSERIVLRRTGLGEDDSLRERAVAVGLTLLGAYFMVRGAATLAQLIRFIGGSGAPASLYAGVTGRALVAIGAGALLFGKASDLGRPIEQRAGSAPRRAIVIGLGLLGAWFTVGGAQDLVGWTAFGDRELPQVVRPALEFALGLALFRGTLDGFAEDDDATPSRPDPGVTPTT